MSKVKEKWEELTGQYSRNSELINQLWTEIEKSYTAKKRHYHNLNHLGYMLGLADTYKPALQDSDCLQFAVFYHDLVYSTTRQDNEQRSTELAGQRLSTLGLGEEKIRRVGRQIMATKDHQADSDSDTLYLIDFDLAILGEPPSVYADYVQKIRAEYAMYPDFLYKIGRKKVLQHFLNMDTLFKTREFIDTYEPQARENLEAELEEL